MASKNPNDTTSAIRHRIKDIALHPTSSKHPIELEILIDNKPLYKLPAIVADQPLRWDMQTYPCDAYVGSAIGLKFIEKHRTSTDRGVLAEYTVSDGVNQVPITKQVGAFPSLFSSFRFSSKKPTAAAQSKSLEVTVTFPNPIEISNKYTKSLAKAAEMVEGSHGPLDRLGNSRVVLKTILGFGAVAAELHPTAKLVVGLCTKAWEHLEKIPGQYDDLQRLVDGLDQMCPFIESIKDRAREEALKHTILSLLYLIEDTSDFVINYLTDNEAVQTFRGLVDAKTPDRISELLRKLRDLKENFDRGVGVQVMKQVLSAAQCALIDRLKPPVTSLDSKPALCQEGTRTQVIEDICAWVDNTNSPQKLLWLYGQAGMGKSSISASICQILLDAGTLGAHFFFKRDDPYLRSPEHMLNTIVHRLAFQYEPYGRAVAAAIESYSGLLDMPLGQRYVHLVERPLHSLASAGDIQSKTFVVVVDALDECENTSSRRSLLTYLREMSVIVPWLKVFITSRPDQDIKAAFGRTTDNTVMLRNLVDYHALDDISTFTRTRMAGIAEDHGQLEWPEGSIGLLSTRAAGLFIWVETVCKFIEKGADPRERLNRILEGTQSTGASTSLDMLYRTAIRQGMGDEDSDNVRSFRECLGAVVSTASRTPLSVASLESLLSSHIRHGLIRMVVSKLGSVLYEDSNHGGAVRVYHPSFSDFILDRARSGDFYTEPGHQNEVLADCCLRTMKQDLKFNICGLETSHVLNRDVQDLETRVLKSIGGHVAYSCIHWTSHLTETPGGTHQEQLGAFLYSPKLMYWIEAMSLLGQLRIALANLLRLVAWTSSGMESYYNYANDVYRFVLMFYDAISESTPHLYISALTFAPTGSKLAEEMRPAFTRTFTITEGANESWPSWLQTMGHNGAVYSMACSPDNRRTVSGSSDGTVRIWDSETGAAVSEPLESPDVYQVAIASDGRRIASGSYHGTLRAWNAETGAALGEPFRGQSDGLISISFSPDDRRILSSHVNGTVYAWDIESGTKISELHLQHSGEVLSTALSPDGRHIASSSRDQTIRVWDAETGAPITKPLAGHTTQVRCVAFSPNGSLLASGSDDATVRLWDINTAELLCHRLIGHSKLVYSVAFSPNGRYLVSGSLDKTVRVWDVETGMPVGEPLVGHTDLVRSVAFCSNGRRVVSASDDHTVRIWDVGADVAVSKALPGHSDEVTSIVFSPDGSYLASGSDNGPVHIWDAQTGAEAFKPLIAGKGGVRSVVFTPNSQRILSLASDGTAQFWDVATGVLAAELSLGHSGSVLSISLSLDGRRIASGSRDGTVGLCDVDTGAAMFPPLAGHSDRVNSVALSPDGRLIASGSDDCTVRIWDAETSAAMCQPLTGHSSSVNSICFSPDSHRIASGSEDESVRVWDATTGAALLEPLFGYSGWAGSVVFSPNGRHIIYSSGDCKVQMRDANTGVAVAKPLVGHTSLILSVAVSPDGCQVASGSYDRTVRIWDVEVALADPDQLLTALRPAPSTLPLPRSLSTNLLARHANESGWVTSSDGALLLWLPKDHRHIDSDILMSADPLQPRHLLLEFSKFVHGDSWTSVAGGSSHTVA